MLQCVNKRVLFVDDEASILAGIRRLLRSQRNEWDMVFVDNGYDALAEIDNSEIDVIVSDMRMPQMDGAKLLSLVREQSPRTVRIILSGQTDLEATVRRLPLAHQFLHKPCDPEVLKSTIERACALQSRLQDGGLRDVIGRIDVLPSAPRVLAEINEMLSHPVVSAADLAGVIEQDVALSAKILQVVNSSMLGAVLSSSSTLASINEAIDSLGVDVVRNIIAAVNAFETIAAAGSVDPDVIEELDRHSHHVAELAASYVSYDGYKSVAFAGGLMHDIGLLILATFAPDSLKAVLEEVRAGKPIYQAESEIIGASHGELGAYLLELWGLPYELVEMVACHHDALINLDDINPTQALQMAERKATESRPKSDMLWEGL